MQQKFPAPVIDHTLIGRTVSITTNSIPFGREVNRKVSVHHGVVKGVHVQTNANQSRRTEASVTFTDGWSSTYEPEVDEVTLIVHEEPS